MSRRSFVKGAGLLGLFAAGIKALDSKELPSVKVTEAKKDISSFAPPTGATTIQFTAKYADTNQPREVMRLDSSGNLGIGVTPSAFIATTLASSLYDKGFITHSTSMAVGKDNRLWIKVDDEWRRIAIE